VYDRDAGSITGYHLHSECHEHNGDLFYSELPKFSGGKEPPGIWDHDLYPDPANRAAPGLIPKDLAPVVERRINALAHA
jgi:hypothetical protein